MTVQGFKFDFRVYMLIASTNPLVAFYHDGFLKLCLEKYSRNSTESDSHVASIHGVHSAFE